MNRPNKFLDGDGERRTKQVEKALRWLLDHGQEDTPVTVGCKDCDEAKDLLASTALTAWLNPFHYGHAVWMRNPFRSKK